MALRFRKRACWVRGFDAAQLWAYRHIMPYDAPDFSRLSLAEIAELVATRKLPPVESWQPEQSGESEMRIAADGRWYHQGGEITRPAMIRAFSSLLRCEKDGSYSLVTPQQKLSVEVDDVPFLAVELQSNGSGANRTLAFRLNSDDLVVAGPEHVLKWRRALPYLHVRGGLWAKMARPVYYELAELALAENPGHPSLWSKGIEFQIGTPT
jgi:uncharacterized protein